MPTAAVAARLRETIVVLGLDPADGVVTWDDAQHALCMEMFDEQVDPQVYMELAHLYMPDIVEGTLDDSNGDRSHMYLDALTHIGRLPIGHRFFRTRPHLLEPLLDRIARHSRLNDFDMIQALEGTHDVRGSLDRRNLIWSEIELNLVRMITAQVLVLPDFKTRLASPSPHFSRYLDRLMRYFPYLVDCPIDDFMDMLVPCVGEILHFTQRMESLPELADTYPGEFWWTGCAACVGDEVEFLSPCLPLLPGKELLACGRCSTVRYCSTQHQKAHWPIHKASCRASIWPSG